VQTWPEKPIVGVVGANVPRASSLPLIEKGNGPIFQGWPTGAGWQAGILHPIPPQDAAVVDSLAAFLSALLAFPLLAAFEALEAVQEVRKQLEPSKELKALAYDVLSAGVPR
jgi:hypothetical protein